MEVRPPTFAARLFDAIGWGARIPKPSGPSLVRSFHFRVPGEHGVLTQVFFPVNVVDNPELMKGSGESNSAAMKRAYRNGVLRGFSYFSSTPRFLFDVFLGASPHPLADVPPHATPVVHEDGPHAMPLVVFSHGLGGNCEVYTKCCSDLASYGFIVVALEHEDGSGSHAKTLNGDVVKYQRPPQGMPYTREKVINFRAPFLKKRESEIRRTVEFFTSSKEEELAAKNDDKDLLHVLANIHPDKIFLAGHSFGAAATVHTVRAWPGRFIGAILMDLWPYPIPNLEQGLGDIPVCSILSEPFERSQESFLTWKLLRNSRNVRLNMFIPGSVHSSFSDTPWWAPMWLAGKFHLRGSIEPDLVQKALNDAYVAFMNKILKDRDGSVLADASTVKTGLQQQEFLEKNPMFKPFVKGA